jgi:RNA polymerase sigma-70 factor (sigma-E family)
MEEPESLREFVAARGVALLRTAYLLTGGHEQARDLLQSALAKVIPRWGRVRTGDPEAYLRRVMYNERTSLWRARRYREVSLPQPLDAVVGGRSAGPDEADRAERRLVVARALARLAPRQRAVIVLRFFEDRSEAEAAVVLGCSVGTIKSQTSKALARLRQVAPELAELTGRSACRECVDRDRGDCGRGGCVSSRREGVSR